MILKNPAIDSLRLRIKVDRVKFTPEGKRLLFDKKIPLSLSELEKLLNSEDITLDEIEKAEYENFKRMAYIPKELEEQGIKLKLLVVSMYFPFHPELNGDYLEIQVNSKILKKDYFKGITFETVGRIYKELMDLKLFDFSYEDFLNSQVVDIDIKMDIEGINSKKFTKFITLLNNIKEGELHIGNSNLGLQYGYRHKSSQYISKPFIKLYYKPIELVNNSPLFYKTFLEQEYGRGAYRLKLARIEGTIKNKTHLRSLGIKDNRFRVVLDKLTPKRIAGILGSFLDRHLKIKKDESFNVMENLRGVSFMSKNDIDLTLLVKSYIKRGYTLEMIQNTLKLAYESMELHRTTIYRRLNKVRKIFRYLIENDEDLKVEKSFLEFLSLIFGEVI